jgi:hypothetical protein
MRFSIVFSSFASKFKLKVQWMFDIVRQTKQGYFVVEKGVNNIGIALCTNSECEKGVNMDIYYLYDGIYI